MSVAVSQQKLAERLLILNDHAIGITTRIYNIKKACGDPKSKPAFLSDRQLEPALKHIVKKFPTIDVRGGGAGTQLVQNIRADILKSLQLYYYTFVDLLELRDHINELLTTIDACQLQLDFAINIDLTVHYLDLVTRYIALMILLSRVDDRKAVLGLYNTAYELQNNSAEPSFPRLGQMIIDYEQPLRKLSEEFVPHTRILYNALASLNNVYARRNLTAKDWREAQMLSITAAPLQILQASQTETIACEFVSLERMERWIIFGLMICHGVLGQPVVTDLWGAALQNSLCTTIFRDEVLHIHSYVQQFFESIKSYNRRAADLKDLFQAASQQALFKHRERRKFLRTALRELTLLFKDEPGLLGPKVLFVWMALSFARDEVDWIVRHAEHWPIQTKAGKVPDDLIDRQLPELLFYMEELRSLVIRYSQVIQRYYVKYMTGYDSVAMNELIQSLAACPEEESVILSSICNSISDLQVDDSQNYDFRAIRIDWCRLQAYMSCGRGAGLLNENRKLAQLMNTLVFHTRMVDWLEQMLAETSDLAIFCFYTSQFERWFQLCLELPSQARFLPAFPLICSHFTNSLHQLCPEERQHIGERSLTLCNLFLDEIAKEARNVLTNIAEIHCVNADKLLPKYCAKLLAETVEFQRKSEKKSKKGENPATAQGAQRPPVVLPGQESERRSLQEFATVDKLQFALTELCCAINYCRNFKISPSYTPTIVVWEHTFAPREYFTQHLETRFCKTLLGMVMYNAERQEIAKPSELVSSVRAFMSVLQSVDNYVHLDLTRIFNNVLLQQTQPQDPFGDETVATLYTKWYLEVLLRRVSSGHILFSPHQEAFVLHPQAEASLHFNPQEYTDIGELRALSELLGPYGVKYICERLTWHVASQIGELKKLTIQHKELLRAMRSNFDKPERMKELYRELVVAVMGQKGTGDQSQNLLTRLAIVGEILSFRNLLQSALSDALEDRIPFLFSSILDLQKEGPPADHPELLNAYELFGTAGLKAPIDATLVNALKAQAQQQGQQAALPPGEDDYHINCLLLVFIAECLPKFATLPSGFYKASIGAHLNNAHCIGLAINEIAAALFANQSRGQLEIADRMKEFLALASGSLLRLVQEPGDRAQLPNLESSYILLDKMVDGSPWLSVDLLESCFPYVLLRSAYHCTYKQEKFHPGI